MGQRTTFLIVQANTPREAVYWHWWHDDIEGIAGELPALPEVVVRALSVACGNLGGGATGRMLRKWLPRFTPTKEPTEQDLRQDVAFLDEDEVINLAAAGEVCVVIDVLAADHVLIDAIIAAPTVAKLRGYLGMVVDAPA